MRYILSAMLVCVLGAPSASALPVNAAATSLSNSELLVAVAKRSGGGKSAVSSSSKSTKSAKSKKEDNGIHPLVGSGDY